MNDIINPIGFDITKKLHGHVRVETRSRWTGRVVDSQEKGNIVTDAVLKMLYTTQWGNGPLASYWYPIYSKALGGLFLFDNTLTESAANIEFPSSAKLVGFAGQGADTARTNGGSYNAAESGLISNGFTSVWDFLTSQANGTIASVCRTSYQFPSYPVGFSASYNSIANGRTDTITSFYIIGYDDTNKYLYFVPTGSYTFNGVTYSTSTLCRIHFDFSKITLEGGMPPASQITIVKTLTSSDGTTNAHYFTYDKYANNFIYANGTTLHILAADGTHTTKTISGTSGNNNGPFITATENYYWRWNNLSGVTIYRINKSNLADVGSYTTPVSANIVPCGDDTVIARGTTTASWCWILYPDGTYIDLAIAGQLSYPTRRSGLIYSHNNSTNNPMYMEPCSHYLGTIANLDSPVTKTSSQTMKITYTLTEA